MVGNKRIYSTITLLSWLLTAGVMAYGGMAKNWEVDGLNGGLNVYAALTESPCSLAPESALQEINFGNIAQQRLANVGELSRPLPVHFILEHCFSGESIRDVGHGDNLYWLAGQPLVLMTINGDEVPENPHLYKLHGEATGVALRLEDSQHHVLLPGERSRPQMLNAGRNDIHLNAQLIRLPKPLLPGRFMAVVHVNLEYL